MEAVNVQGLSWAYQGKRGRVLKEISFQVKKGEMIALAGLSGCGKSTLCLCLNGIIPHLFGGVMLGQVWINGKNTRDCKVAELAREVGVVFQDPDTQLVSATVEDEIAFALENMCFIPKLIRERVDQVLELLGITTLKIRNPHLLSGGEKQLVVLGAVLAADPPVLVLDEVMSQLDQEGKKRIWQVLGNLQSQGKTILFVEHDREVLALADRVMMFDEGSLVKDGPPSCVL